MEIETTADWSVCLCSDWSDTFTPVTDTIDLLTALALASLPVTISVFFIGSVQTTNNPEYQTFFQIDVCALCVRFYQTDRETKVLSLS